MSDLSCKGELSKVLFRVRDDAGEAAETLWALNLGEDRYKIANLPFYAYGVSFDDIVHAPLGASEKFPVFESVLTKSGNRTIRLIIDASPDSGSRSKKLLDDLRRLECGWEGLNKTYFAVNVPGYVSIETVEKILDESGINWEMADPIK